MVSLKYQDPADEQWKPVVGPHHHDSRYVNVDGDTMTGPLVVPDLQVTGEDASPGQVWTAEDSEGRGGWQDPGGLVVADTSDPVLINWFDGDAETWHKWYGDGSLTFEEIPSPSVPGALTLQAVGTPDARVFAEWGVAPLGSSGAVPPLVFEPEALYRMTVRVRMTPDAVLSFGFQCYDAAKAQVGSGNVSNPLLNHWAGDSVMVGVDEAHAPPQEGQWVGFTGYLSGKAAGAAENLPAAGTTAPADPAVKVAATAVYWRPTIAVTAGTVWVDGVQVYRLDRQLTLPGGITASTVNAEGVHTDDLSTLAFSMPPSTSSHALTAMDADGTGEWQPVARFGDGNLFFNGDLSLGLAGWSGARVSMLQVYDEGNYLRATVNDATLGDVSQRAYNQFNSATKVGYPVRVTAGRTYRHAGEVRSSKSWQMTGAVWWYDEAGTILSTPVGTAVTSSPTTWVPFGSDFVAPAGAVYAQFAVGPAAASTDRAISDTFDVRSMYVAELVLPDPPDGALMLTLDRRIRDIMYDPLTAGWTEVTSSTLGTAVPGSRTITLVLDRPGWLRLDLNAFVQVVTGAGTSPTLNVYPLVYDAAGTGLSMRDMRTNSDTGPWLSGAGRVACITSSTITTTRGWWARYLPAGTYTVKAGADKDSTPTVNINYLSWDIEFDPDASPLTALSSPT